MLWPKVQTAAPSQPPDLGAGTAPKEEASTQKAAKTPSKNIPLKKRSKIPFILSETILVLLITCGALCFSGIISFGSGDEQAQAEGGVAAQNATALPQNKGEIKDIIFQNTKQYFVNNEKLRQLFVVEGKTINNYQTSTELIRLGASLLDEYGTVVPANSNTAE